MNNNTIDSEVLVSDLVEQWINGNRVYVLDILESDHPGLTAIMIVQGSQDRALSIEDCNSITNMLIDRRQQQYLDRS